MVAACYGRRGDAETYCACGQRERESWRTGRGDASTREAVQRCARHGCGGSGSDWGWTAWRVRRKSPNRDRTGARCSACEGDDALVPFPCCGEGSDDVQWMSRLYRQ